MSNLKLDTKPKAAPKDTDLEANAAKEQTEADAAKETFERENAEAIEARKAAADARAEKLAEAEKLAHEAAELSAKAEAARKAAAEAASGVATEGPLLSTPGHGLTIAEEAKLVEKPRETTYVKSASGHSYCDPETGKKIVPDEVTKLPYVSAWVRSQITAGFIVVTDAVGE